MDLRITLWQGDITKLAVDAIVNAANSSLLGGGGVDGAIHRAAGPKLVLECMGLRGCKTGEAKITKGYNLPAKYVIHTVGPVWNGGTNNQSEKLANCYRNSLRVAVENALKTVAFPAISTGIYSYPLQEAAGVAVRTVEEFLANNKTLDRVVFVAYDTHTLEAYRAELGAVTESVG